jgi:hypothetical protein
MLSRWASQEFSTDWGTRDLSPSVSFYDPISYHQGSVWPLFTGWVSLSEYRNGRSLSAYAHLMQNADLTWVQDSGRVTSCSGEFFRRWSVRLSCGRRPEITPTSGKGIFGLNGTSREQTDGYAQFAGQWNEAKLLGVPLGVNLELYTTKWPTSFAYWWAVLCTFARVVGVLKGEL